MGILSYGLWQNLHSWFTRTPMVEGEVTRELIVVTRPQKMLNFRGYKYFPSPDDFFPNASLSIFISYDPKSTSSDEKSIFSSFLNRVILVFPIGLEKVIFKGILDGRRGRGGVTKEMLLKFQELLFQIPATLVSSWSLGRGP